MHSTSLLARQERAKQLLKNACAVCFDVDSTVTVGEGIDELADYCGIGDAVAQWTKQAMGGGVTFREALSARLNLMKPSRRQTEDFLRERPPVLTAGVREFVSLLHQRGKSVYLVSGGFRQLIEPLRHELNIPESHIFANKLYFDDETGEYTGFDVREPTSETGGKARAVEMIKQRDKHETVVMIGDGVTDLEARPFASAVIGFGGNVVRERVVNEADWFVKDFRELVQALQQQQQEDEEDEEQQS